MKNYLFLNIILLSLIFTCLKADEYQDSLKNELTKNPKYSVELQLKFKLAESYLFIDMDTSVILINQTIGVADEERDSSFFADAYHLAGYIAFHKSNYDTAVYLFQKSFTFYDTLAEHSRYFKTKVFSISCDIFNYNLDIAYNQLVRLEEMPDLSILEIVKITNLYALLFDKKGDNEAALPILLKNLPLIDSIDDARYKIQYYSNLGYVYKELGLLEKAKNYFSKNFQLSKSLKIDYYKISSGVVLAEIYFLEKKWSKAISFFQEASDYFFMVEDWTQYVLMQCRLVESYSSLSKTKEATNCLKRAESKFDQVNDGGVILAYYNVEALYYQKLNDFEKAYLFLKLYQNYNDSLYRLDNIEELNELIIKYKTEKKEKENVILKQKLEIETVKNNKVIYSWIGTVFFAVILIVIFFLYRRNVRQGRALNVENTLRLEQENKLLETQKEVANQKLQSHKAIFNSTNNSLLQQSQLTSILITALKELKPHSNIEGQKKINSILADLSNFSKEKKWHTFEQNFVLLYPDFLINLTRKYPSLTIAERKQTTFLKMGLSSSEISEITLQEKHSIYRLNKKIRDKIGVETNEELILLLKKIG